MIKTVIRTHEDMVFAFDEDGRQMPEFQGSYEEIGSKILREAGAGTVFKHWPADAPEPETVSRDNW